MSLLTVSEDTIACVGWERNPAGFWSFAVTVLIRGGLAGRGLVFKGGLVWSRFGGRPQWRLLVPGRELQIYGEQEAALRERVIDELYQVLFSHVVDLPERTG